MPVSIRLSIGDGHGGGRHEAGDRDGSEDGESPVSHMPLLSAVLCSFRSVSRFAHAKPAVKARASASGVCAVHSGLDLRKGMDPELVIRAQRGDARRRRLTR
jgi:hypothetical protein